MAFVNIVTNSAILGVVFLSGALACSGSGLIMTSPKTMEALSGSCLQIPCMFRENPDITDTIDFKRNTFGVWLIDTYRTIYNSSIVNNKFYPMTITGDLAQGDCATLFSNLTTDYTGTYFFRIANWPFMATAICDPLNITVKDSPPSPIIKIPGKLKEKQTVNVTCWAPAPCPLSPPRLTWNLQSASEKTQQKANGIFQEIQATLHLSDKHNGMSINCVASYSVTEGNDKTSEINVQLNVSHGPKDTVASIRPSNSVSPGSMMNLTCSSRANPPARRFTWFQSTEGGDSEVYEGHVYSLNATTKGVYYCIATNDFGNQRSPDIHLNMIGDSSTQWEPIVGGVIGVIVLICLVVCVWWLKSTHGALQQTQSQTGEAPICEEPDIHYGEIDLSRLETKQACGTVGGSQEHQDTVYAHVKVSEPANTRTHTEDIYAQVKKH